MELLASPKPCEAQGLPSIMFPTTHLGENRMGARPKPWEANSQ